MSVGLPIEPTIEKLNPQVTFLSHVMELGHSPTPPQAWRWSFAFAFDKIRNTPPEKAIVLTWGERWLLQGTVLEP